MAFSRSTPKLETPRKPPPLRVLLYCAGILLGFGIAGTGLNLVLINQGIRQDPGERVSVNVENCSSSNCRVTYMRNDELVNATYFLQGMKQPAAHSQLEGYVYPKHADRVYPTTSVPLPFAASLLFAGICSFSLFGYKLFHYWKAEAA